MAAGRGRPSGAAPDRQARLARDVQRLRVGSGRLSVDERVLMIAGGVLAPVGLLLVVLGWFGASRTPNVREQIPYLISGGLLGCALVFLGGFLYFSHWLTQLVHDQRAGSAAVVDAFHRLADVVDRREAAAANRAGAGADAPARMPRLVVTETGTMAHRPSCRVVAGKAGVRAVQPEDRLTACRLCLPER